MKKIIFLLLFPVFIFAQYEKGYKDGYCKAHKEATNQYAPCPIVGVVPIAKVGQETYQDGFARGYNSYKASGNTSSGVGIVSDANLIQGAKDLGKASQPVDIGKAFSDGFNQAYSAAAVKIKYGEPSTEIITPVAEDLKNYTHIALVQVYRSTKTAFKNMAANLETSIFTVINPADKKNKDFKKKFKENKMFLRGVKNEKWIYFYADDSRKTIDGLVYDTDLITLRDYENNILYQAKEINRSWKEVVSFLLSY